MINELEVTASGAIMGAGSSETHLDQSNTLEQISHHSPPICQEIDVNMSKTLSRLSKIMKPNLERGLKINTGSFKLKSMVLDNQMQDHALAIQ